MVVQKGEHTFEVHKAATLEMTFTYQEDNNWLPIIWMGILHAEYKFIGNSHLVQSGQHQCSEP